MLPDKQSIGSAHDRIKPYIHHTPVMTSESLNAMTGSSLFFKCENFQKVGAFKSRGAMNAILKLSKDQLAKGVATHSSGNHAQALARAAKLLGVKAYIVMPTTAPEIKKRGVKAYGGEIFECEPTLTARESTLEDVIKKTSATEIHPFNNYDVMEGQATCAKELFEEIPNLHFIIVPVGGGGLLAGTALGTKHYSPSTEVIAGEPAGSDDAYRSLKSGKIESAQSNTIADGLLTTLGSKTFPIIFEHVRTIITVSDEEIITAMRFIWERLKIIVEPSCSVPFAAVLKDPSRFKGKRIGIILTGGNVDLERAAKLFSKRP